MTTTTHSHKAWTNKGGHVTMLVKATLRTSPSSGQAGTGSLRSPPYTSCLTLRGSVPPPLYPAMHKLHCSPKPPQTECEQAD